MARFMVSAATLEREVIDQPSTISLIFILTPKSATASAPLDNRFYEYDPSSRTWLDLTDVSQFGQTKPPARKAHGLSSSNGKLYIFGGETNESGLICIW
jgi:N-acetylneuraminic acid mutarotase